MLADFSWQVAKLKARLLSSDGGDDPPEWTAEQKESGSKPREHVPSFVAARSARHAAEEAEEAQRKPKQRGGRAAPRQARDSDEAVQASYLY